MNLSQDDCDFIAKLLLEGNETIRRMTGVDKPKAERSEAR